MSIATTSNKEVANVRALPEGFRADAANLCVAPPIVRALLALRRRALILTSLRKIRHLGFLR